MSENLTTEEIIEAAESWRVWGERFGWRCYGTCGKDSAGFHRIADGHRAEPFDITGNMRGDIDRVLQNQFTEWMKS